MPSGRGDFLRDGGAEVLDFGVAFSAAKRRHRRGLRVSSR